MHYLINHDRDRFNRLLRALREGRDVNEAWSELYPNIDQLSPKVVEHLDGGEFMALTIGLYPPPRPAPLVELSPGEVHRVRADIVASAFRLTPAARKRRFEQEEQLALTLGAPPRPPEGSSVRPASAELLVPKVPGLASTTRGGSLQRHQRHESVLDVKFTEPEPVWSQRAVTLSTDRPMDAAALLDENQPMTELATLHNVWVAAVVLGDCERLKRVHAAATAAFGQNAVTRVGQHLEALCVDAVRDPPEQCTKESAKQLTKLTNVVLQTLVDAVALAEGVAATQGSAEVTIRADGSLEVGSVVLDPNKELFIVGAKRLLERSKVSPPCGGKSVTFELPIRFQQAGP
ncbi:MAG: hypothetical protein JNK82_12580 [Myxococcaceae bacterium]|nr:hypothetical protein [Myxococcaceae bacterium]